MKGEGRMGGKSKGEGRVSPPNLKTELGSCLRLIIIIIIIIIILKRRLISHRNMPGDITRARYTN